MLLSCVSDERRQIHTVRPEMRVTCLWDKCKRKETQVVTAHIGETRQEFARRPHRKRGH